MIFTDISEQSTFSFGNGLLNNSDSTLEEDNLFNISPYCVETLKDDSPLVLEEIDKNFSSDVLSNLEKSENFTKKKRGKRTYNTKNKEHTKNKNDNRVIKIQSHYFNFIITFLNELMEIFKIKKNLCQ